MRTAKVLAAIAAAAIVVNIPASAGVQQQLALGAPISAATGGSSKPAVFAFNADSAGVLTIVVRGQGDADLFITVTDQLGQQLPDGRSDQDISGDTGAEQLVVTIPMAGSYNVEIGAWGSGGDFDIAAGWISYPALGRAPDPDGMPTEANDLVPGSPISDQIDTGSGDGWDWYKITAETDSVITVLTEAPDGDLVLEMYNDGEFGQYDQRSDNDMGGVSGNESITVQARAGQTYYFKVMPFSDGAGNIPYTIRAGIM